MRYVFFIAAMLLASRSFGQEIVEIPPPDGFSYAIPEDVADAGSIVVGFATATNRPRAAFRWSPDSGTELLPGLPGFAAYRAAAVSADGTTILGELQSESGTSQVVLWHANGTIEQLRLPTRWIRVGAHDLSHDGAVAIGFGIEADHTIRAWRWTRLGGVRIIDLPAGATLTQAIVLSGDGQYAFGHTDDSAGRISPCRWDAEGNIERLPFPSDQEQIHPWATNHDGSVVVGWGFDSFVNIVSYVWSEDAGYAGLPELEGLHTFGASALSPDGTIWIDNPFDNVYLWREDVGLYEAERVLEARGLRLSTLRVHYVTNVSPDGTAILGVGDDRPHAGGGVDRAWLITNFSLPTNCPPDIDLNEQLDTFDFMAFINRFNSGDPRADLDGDGVLTIGDFLAYQAAFDAGC